jgi:hypothetical protein
VDIALGDGGVEKVVEVLSSWIVWPGEKGSSWGSFSSEHDGNISVLEHRTLLLKNIPLGGRIFRR